MRYKLPYVPQGDKRNKKWVFEKSVRSWKTLLDDESLAVIYDIGANIGDHSVFLAKEFNSFVYAFEPIKEYYDLMLKNIKHYNVETVKAFAIGLGDKNTTIKMSVDNEASSAKFYTTSNFIEVQVRTLDSLFEEGGMKPPTLLKIDVEGFGAEVVKGSKNVISKYKPIIIFEPHPEFVDKAGFFEKKNVLNKLGYVTFHADGDEILLMHKSKLDDNSIKDYLWLEIYLRRQKYSYERAKTKSKAEEILKDYRSIHKEYKKITKSNPMFYWLIWSKLYRFFTFKW